ncbi:dienelactone hydrolase family protein [Streptomyces sp. NRRL S-87]|uniref:dienelactone hydrolase family protein n=1 Tax=Streptomyces sp. NRRL S-87 TaxID=1463920 RepID=UPI0006897752|nr:dienelactone hydrolase family protein [Streptomyces sp. NRRL S-87]
MATERAEQQVGIPIGGGLAVDGDLALPPGARLVVVFAHGSGSSRHSPRNRAVAAALRTAPLGTLLLDLLTPGEEAVDDLTAEHRFDIPLLAGRLVAAVDWLAARPGLADLSVGLFGASTGAAAALRAAADRPDRIRAVVSRGGRPDLAGDEALERVRAPVLLLVGGLDTEVLRLNRAAAGRLTAPHTVTVVPGATHLFPEPGALERVADAARAWFLRPGGTAAEERPRRTP